MALEPDYLDDTPVVPKGEESGWLPVDAAKAAGATVVDLGAQAAGAMADLRNPTDLAGQPRDPRPTEVMRAGQNLLNEVNETIKANISPANRRAMEAELVPTEGAQSIGTAPFKSGVMKVAGITPMLLAAYLLPAGWAGVATGSAFFGTQGVAQQLNETRKRVMTMSDEALQQRSQPYRELRTGMEEGPAREQFINKQDDLMSLLLAGGSQAVGGGAIAHSFKAQAARGALRGAGVGTAEGVVGGAAMGAGMQGARQRADVNAGLRESYDPVKMAVAALNSGFELGVLGAGTGAVGGAVSRRAAKAKETGREVAEIAPDPAQAEALKQQFDETSSTGRPTADEMTPLPPEAPAPGSLQQRIDAERARLAAETPAEQPPVQPGVPPVVEPPVTPSLPQPTAPRPVAPPAQEQMIPMPPTDRIPPTRPSRVPPERTAVPLEEPIDAPVTPTGKGRLTVPEVAQAIEAMPKKTVSEAPKVETLNIDALNQAVKVVIDKTIPSPTSRGERGPGYVVLRRTESGADILRDSGKQEYLTNDKLAELAEAPVTPAGKLTLKPRVFAAPVDPAIAAAKAAREEAIVKERAKEGEAVARRDRRLRNEIQPNETAAKKIVQDTHPSDAEALTQFHADETAALGGQPTTDRARETLLARARKVVALAEEAGVTIPSRTTWTKEMLAAGNKNPTPYTSRMTELVKFQRLVGIAARIPDVIKREAALKKLFADHVSAERALREGDLGEAARRRLEANEKRDARHEAAELKRLLKEQQSDKARDRAMEREQEAPPDDDVETLASREGSSVRPVSTEEHYKLPPSGVRKSNVRTELGRLVADFDNVKDPKVAPKARLMQQIMRKLVKVVGDQPINFADDASFFAANPDSPATYEGLFRGYARGALKGGERGDIWIRNDLVHTIEGPRIIIHEAVHAATKHAIDHTPSIRADLEVLLAYVAGNTGRFGDLTKEYGFKAGNTHEFVAEGLANPRFQKFLIEVEAPSALIKKYGLTSDRSMWRAFVETIARLFGLGKQHITSLDAMLRISDELMAYEPLTVHRSIEDLRRAAARGQTEASVGSLASRSLDNRVSDARDALAHVPATLRSKLRGMGLKLATFEQMAQIAERSFGPDTPASKLVKLLGRQATEKERILNSGDIKLVSDMARAERKYAGTGKWDDFGELLVNETMAGAFADKPLDQQPHLGKDAMKGWQPKAQHADIVKAYDKLPDDLKAMRTRLHKYFRDRQNALSLERLKNIVRVIDDGRPNDALAQKIFDGTLDDAEKAVLKKDAIFKAITDARALSKITGPYVPLMRHGDHVVSGRYDVTSPGNARRMTADGALDPKGDVFEFATKDEAKAFAEAQDLKVLQIKRVYTDPKTGERWSLDENGEKHKLTKEDAGWGQADERYRVTLQDRHLEFFESEIAARQRYDELKSDPKTRLRMDGVAPRRWEPGGANATFMSETFNRALNSLRQRNGFKELDAGAQRELIEHLTNASLAALGSTRAQSRRLPRTFVAGASADIMKNTGQYASTSAGYLSRLKFQPEVDAQLKTMTDYEYDHRHQATELTYPRGQLLKEMKSRVYKAGEPESFSLTTRIINRALQMSFLDKLASPAFHVINSSEPWTVSLPVLAGRFGVGRTLVAINQAYRDIGAGSAIGAGLRDTGRALRTDTTGPGGLTDYLKRFQDRLKKAPDGKHVGRMLEELYDVGLLSRDAGMELQRMATPGGPRLGRALDRADLMARQMGTAIESINRAVTGIAAYRLEYAKGKDHAAAVEFARKKVVDTMGDYAGWNAAPIFNHPVGRLALQFKKYAQKTYYLLGKTALASFRGDREAMKAFAGLMATHFTVAGSLGLPLEAVKVAFLAANLTGLTSTNYSDFEEWVRKQAADVFGVGGGQIVTRGVPRYLGVDLANRMSFADLALPMGEPRSMKTDDLLAYGAKAFSGAPIGMVLEWQKGVSALWEGNVAEATQKLVPIKLFADSIQAYQRMTEGKKTPSGRETLAPYGAGEAALKVLGFTPGRDAETGEMRAAVSRSQRQFKEERTQLATKWVTATPAEKSAMWQRVQRWNEGQPREAQITMKELTAALQRRTRESSNADYEFGLRTTKRDRHLRGEAEVYNVR